ncbi:Required for respiratory growth protein 9 mitochondrial [Diatrype stigma]|uniref:Required for respiratory growth protein 9, mitochondrial n=1 Tax=Diatrype stigma TaxID=117547 RepID=A0AAN9UF19_9PEZI
MRCTCRTSSLRIFVQSLTGFRVAHSAIPRSVQIPIHPASFATSQPLIRQRYLTRAFSAAATLRSSQDAHEPSIPRIEESTDSGHPPNERQEPDNVAKEKASPAIISTSADSLDWAKQNHVVLDFSPEALDLLMANHEPTDPTELGITTKSRSRSERKPASASRGSSSSRSASNNDSKFNRSKPIPQNLKIAANRRERKDDEDGNEDDYDDYDDYEGEEVEEGGGGGGGGRNNRDNHNNHNDKRHAHKKMQRVPKDYWKIEKAALKAKFPEGWNPRKKLSPDALEGIRALHAQFPTEYTTEALARQFEVSPEAIRRILRTRWQPASADEEARRQERWFNRGKRVWEQLAALGKKPPRRWRQEGIVRDPSWHEGRYAKRKGPRTEWPYMPHRKSADLARAELQRELAKGMGVEGEGAAGAAEGDGQGQVQGQERVVSPQRKLSDSLL